MLLRMMTSLAENTETTLMTMMEKSFMMLDAAAAAAGADDHQIPLWVISILSLLRLYPQSGMGELVSESLKHS